MHQIVGHNEQQAKHSSIRIWAAVLKIYSMFHKNKPLHRSKEKQKHSIICIRFLMISAGLLFDLFFLRSVTQRVKRRSQLHSNQTASIVNYIVFLCADLCVTMNIWQHLQCSEYLAVPGVPVC